MTLANALRLLSVVLVALPMAAGFAHLYALPNKIDLPAEEYFVVQQIYAGWALLGGPDPRRDRLDDCARRARAAAGRRVPARRHGPRLHRPRPRDLLRVHVPRESGENWTTVPADWEALRFRWEYSHAAGALLQLAALIALTLSLIVRGNRADASSSRREVDVG